MPSPTGDREDLTGLFHRAPLLDVCRLAEDDATDLVLLEVHRESDDAAGKLEHLVRHGSRKPGDARDPIAHLIHATHLFAFEARLEIRNVLAEGGGDVLRSDREVGVCH